jgi:hypothetical protein
MSSMKCLVWLILLFLAIDRGGYLMFKNPFDKKSELFPWTGKQSICIFLPITLLQAPQTLLLVLFDNNQVILSLPPFLQAILRVYRAYPKTYNQADN